MFARRLLALAVSAALSAPALAAELRRVERPVPGHYIVVFQDDAIDDRARAPDGRAGGDAAVAAAVEDAAVDIAAHHDLAVSHVYAHAVRGMAVRAGPEAVQRLLADPRVAYVEEDGLVVPSATQTNAPWNLDRIDQSHLPLDGLYTYHYTGTNVRAYVIDSGIRAGHVEFGGRVLPGYTVITDGNGTADCLGHGTHLAGTVGGTTWGVAKRVLLVPVRVIGCNGTTTTSALISGIDWVRLNHAKPAVALIGLTGAASTVIDAATTSLVNSGVTTVVPAGNNAANACNYSPARAPSAVTVGATTPADAVAPFSNYGSCVNLFAPGVDITSAWHTGPTATQTLSGTSMAAAHVAGAAALYLEANPTAPPPVVRGWLDANATPGVLTGAGPGSPDRLLKTL
ncbi:S8 family peptidase [Luteimonas sp. Y-2-2-4F]|nr:S8 family peptidase [Luteimonas sp. Y-2-2-4F]MCD9032858.1 S8 family peptidase [Luteimonas sp. Y-2-2-4F]